MYTVIAGGSYWSVLDTSRGSLFCCYLLGQYALTVCVCVCVCVCACARACVHVCLSIYACGSFQMNTIPDHEESRKP